MINRRAALIAVVLMMANMGTAQQQAQYSGGGGGGNAGQAYQQQQQQQQQQVYPQQYSSGSSNIVSQQPQYQGATYYSTNQQQQSIPAYSNSNGVNEGSGISQIASAVTQAPETAAFTLFPPGHPLYHTLPPHTFPTLPPHSHSHSHPLFAGLVGGETAAAVTPSPIQYQQQPSAVSSQQQQPAGYGPSQQQPAGYGPSQQQQQQWTGYGIREDGTYGTKQLNHPPVNDFWFAEGSLPMYCAMGANPLPVYNTPYKKCVPNHPMCGIAFTCIVDV